MQVEDLFEQLDAAGRRLAAAAFAVDPGTAVPTCPGWTTTDLVQHLCRVHARVAHVVRGRTPDTFSAPIIDGPLLREGYLSGLEDLLKALRAARENLDVATPFRASSPRTFWIRRMTHETTVHQLDAELAADTGMLEVRTAVADDGLDELLLGWVPAAFSTAGVTRSSSITLMPLDINRAWTVIVTPAGVRASDIATDRADLTVAGMASDLYRWAWNRARDEVVSLGGDMALADLWHRAVCIGRPQ